MSKNQELAVFDSLSAEVTKFVAPTLTVKVTDFKTSAEAIEARQVLKSYKKQLKKKVDELVDPLKERIQLIKSLAAKIEDPLDASEAHLKLQVDKYAWEQMQIQNELRRKEEERKREDERKAEAERQRLEAAAEAKKKAELEALERARAREVKPTEKRSAFGRALSADDESAAARQAIEERHETERLEREARLDREKKIREAEAGGREYDIRKANISHARKTYEVEVINIDLVPVSLLKRELKVKDAQALYKAGGFKEIPGLKFTETVSVALGEATHVPRQALEGERPRRSGHE